MSSLSSTTSCSPATEALESFLSTTSNKRVKRSTMDSPSASPFSFDMSELFNQTSEESFPSIEWSFDISDDDDKSVSSTCTKSSTASLSESSLGKRSRDSNSSSCGLSRSKTLRSSIDLLG